MLALDAEYHVNQQRVPRQFAETRDHMFAGLRVLLRGVFGCLWRDRLCSVDGLPEHFAQLAWCLQWEVLLVRCVRCVTVYGVLSDSVCICIARSNRALGGCPANNLNIVYWT